MLSGGAWRNRSGRLCGRFLTNGGMIDIEVETGDSPRGFCSCGKTEYPFCEHAVALVMYAGRFAQVLNKPVPGDEIPSYYGGLRQESFARLAEKLRAPQNAAVMLEVRSALPHVPSKWENVSINVRLRNSEREYLGNLNNLRKLYFDKVLSAVLKFEHFSLQDQQIIRFLAVNGEADNSLISLTAELSAEFFHSLIGHGRFFRDGHRLTVRGEHAEAVIIRNGNKILPGLRVNGSILPVTNAKIVAGKSGCWIGCHSEYYFLPAVHEIGFLRNFFRSGTSVIPPEVDAQKYLSAFPFDVIKMNDPEPEMRRATVLLDGKLLSGEELILFPRYIYPMGDGEMSCRMRSGEFLADSGRFWRRDLAFERNFELTLEMAGFTFNEKGARLCGRDSIGLFLDRILPEYLVTQPALALSGPLGLLLRGGAGVPEPEMRCQLIKKVSDAWQISYQLTAGGQVFDWLLAAEQARDFKEYLHIPGSGVVKLPPVYGKFFRSIGNAVRKLDTASCTFEVPFFNAQYYCALAADIPGALIPELIAGESTPSISGSRFEFQGTLRTYQEEGLAFLARMTDRNLNVILADEMGLGKTIQLLALLAARLKGANAPALIVCPASLVPNWEREAARFVPEMRVAAPQGTERENCLKNSTAFDLLILSYTAARLSRNQLRRISFSYLILDEAQHIKNPGSSNAKSCKDLAAVHKIVLSGTPLENSQEDLWSIMDFLHPGMLGTLPAFRKRYTGLAVSQELREDLARRVGPFIKRRTKAEVASDLPPRTEKIIYCDFSPEQRALYDQTLADGRKEISQCRTDERRFSAAVFTTLLRLRQICCHPALLPEGKGEGIPSAKSELLHELLHENIDSSHKMLLFSQFTSLLQQIIPGLKEENIPFEYLDGSTVDRIKHVDNFNHSPEIPLFLLSLKAGGTGLNLTSADTVIIYDPWWNPAVELQAADRSHRIGQQNPVTIYRLVVRNSVEEKILELQGRKRKLFEAVVESSADSTGLSLEELSFLIESN